MDDVTRALEKAVMPTFVEYVAHGNSKDWNKITRAAVLAFLKGMPNWRNEVSEIPWTPLSLAAAIEKERT